MENKAIVNHETTCIHCLNEYSPDRIKQIYISDLGYNSAFDGFSTRVTLCKECLSKTNQEWWDLELVEEENEFGPKYKFEDEILAFIESLPLSGKESVWNYYSGGHGSYALPSQDFIDRKLGILPHEKCKEYGLYSLEEEAAYKQRFPTCRFPVDEVYHDGSVGCRCHRSAFGKEGGIVGNQTQDECYGCPDYKERIGNIRKIKHNDFGAYQTYINYKLNQNSLDSLFADIDI